VDSAGIESLLRRLVAIDSVSSRPNASMIELLDSELQRLGFATQRHGYRDAAGVEKLNLVGRVGPEPGAANRGLALVGHTDTVPYDPAWRDALSLTRDGDRLLGRGACDTKGFIACALAAAARVDLRELHEPLWLAFTSDEETGCLGAKELVRVSALRPRHAIVGEPTRLRPVRANKGYCLADVRLMGVEGHSAYPDSGASAIAAAAELLGGIEQLAAELATRANGAFDPPHTTLNVGVIAGGKARNIIPGECHFSLEWRPVPGDDPKEVPERVQALLRRLGETHPRVKAELEVQRIDAGVDTPPDAALVRFLEEQTGSKAETVSFGTEAPELAALGAQPVVFGPGDIRVAHQTGEYVPEGDLTRCAEVLEAAIERFCRS
jgi:acetylornithine deacetylase